MTVDVEKRPAPKAEALSKADAAYTWRKDPDPDTAVEELLKWIRELESRFRFKEPLGEEFADAREDAILGLENGPNVYVERNVKAFKEWLGGCLDCYDVILLRYLQKALKAEPRTQDPKRPKEHEVYQKYIDLGKKIGDKDLKDLGKTMMAIWTIRNETVHKWILEGRKKGGKRKRKPPITWETIKDARSHLAKAGAIVLEKYKKKYPSYAD